MAKKKAYEVLSPDGFTIEFDPIHYPTKKAALAAFNVWKTRYEAQGYYSSNNGRIALDDLENHCSFNPIEIDPDEEE